MEYFFLDLVHGGQHPHSPARPAAVARRWQDLPAMALGRDALGCEHATCRATEDAVWRGVPRRGPAGLEPASGSRNSGASPQRGKLTSAVRASLQRPAAWFGQSGVGGQQDGRVAREHYRRRVQHEGAVVGGDEAGFASAWAARGVSASATGAWAGGGADRVGFVGVWWGERAPLRLPPAKPRGERSL